MEINYRQAVDKLSDILDRLEVATISDIENLINEVSLEDKISPNNAPTCLFTGDCTQLFSPGAVNTPLDQNKIRVLMNTDRANFLCDYQEDIYTVFYNAYKNEGKLPALQKQFKTQTEMLGELLYNAKTGVWAKTSKEFVEKAKGEIRIHLEDINNPEKVNHSLGRILGETEIPTALNNPNITKVNGIPLEQFKNVYTLLQSIDQKFFRDLEISKFKSLEEIRKLNVYTTVATTSNIDYYLNQTKAISKGILQIPFENTNPNLLIENIAKRNTELCNIMKLVIKNMMPSFRNEKSNRILNIDSLARNLTAMAINGVINNQHALVNHLDNQLNIQLNRMKKIQQELIHTVNKMNSLTNDLENILKLPIYRNNISSKLEALKRHPDYNVTEYAKLNSDLKKTEELIIKYNLTDEAIENKFNKYLEGSKINQQHNIELINDIKEQITEIETSLQRLDEIEHTDNTKVATNNKLQQDTKEKER